MKHLLKIGATVLVLCGLASCYNDNKEELYQNIKSGPDTTGCNTDAIKFSEVEPIFTDNCALSGCHVGNSPQSGLDLSTYEDASRVASDGRLENRITGSSSIVMPPSGSLPSAQIDLLLEWAKNPCPN